MLTYLFAFAPLSHQWAWAPVTLLLVSQLSFPGHLLGHTNHFILGTPYKTCYFGISLTQSFSHHNLLFIKVTQIFTLAHFSCFEHINFKKWLFTCCLIFLTLWDTPLSHNIHCYSYDLYTLAFPFFHCSPIICLYVLPLRSKDVEA